MAAVVDSVGRGELYHPHVGTWAHGHVAWEVEGAVRDMEWSPRMRVAEGPAGLF